MDDSPVSYTNWLDGRPASGPYNCTVVILDHTKKELIGKWVNQDCNKARDKVSPRGGVCVQPTTFKSKNSDLFLFSRRTQAREEFLGFSKLIGVSCAAIFNT